VNLLHLCIHDLVTAVKDKIYIGGGDKVIILNIDGSLVRKIATHGVNYNLLYNERNDQLLLRQDGRLCCISSVDKLYGSLTWKSNYCFICTWYYSNTPR
jgi:hypothetical protein